MSDSDPLSPTLSTAEEQVSAQVQADDAQPIASEPLGEIAGETVHKAEQDIHAEKHTLLRELHAELGVILSAIEAAAEWPMDKLKELMLKLGSHL